MKLPWRYQGSPLQRFLHWWGSELASFLPAGFREQVRQRDDSLALVPQTDGGWLIVHAFDGHYDVLRRCPPEADAAELSATVASLRTDDAGKQRDLFVLLEADQSLVCELELPAAAEENLREVIGYEMDSHTPFSADQVYFDQVIKDRDRDKTRLTVKLGVSPAAPLEASLERLAEAGLDLKAVDILQRSDADPASIESRQHLNLLPPERRPAPDYTNLRNNAALAVLAIALLAGVMYQSLAVREQRLANLQEQVTNLSVETRQVTRLRQQLEDAIVGANFLVEKKQQERMVVEIINEMTNRLPDDTYATRLTIEDGQFEMQGQSASSSRVISLLTDSPLFSEVNLRGAVQRDARTGKDRFQIEATITPRSEQRAVADTEEGEYANPAG
jgi:general secretion pathway protein L